MFKATGFDIDDYALYDEVTWVCDLVSQERMEEWNETSVTVDGRQAGADFQSFTRKREKSSKFENDSTIFISNSCWMCILIDELLLVRWKKSLIRIRFSSCYENESELNALLV